MNYLIRTYDKTLAKYKDKTIHLIGDIHVKWISVDTYGTSITLDNDNEYRFVCDRKGKCVFIHIKSKFI